MKAIKWEDHFYDDGKRTVLTEKECGIPGVRLFARHMASKALPELQTHYHENCYELVFVAKGQLDFWTGAHKYRVSGGDVFISNPNEEHSTGGTPFSVHEIYWMQLDTSDPKQFLFLNEDTADYLIHMLGKLNNRVVQTYLSTTHQILKQIFYLFHCSQCMRRQEAAALIVLFLCRLIEFDRKTQYILTPDIALAVDYILDNISMAIELEDLADICGLSVSGFKQKFKFQMGSSPREFINYYKIEASKKMLLSNKSITDIAMDLGFNSSNYYSTVFKRYTTMTPTEYMNRQKSGK